jgi:hypothetical protein
MIVYARAGVHCGFLIRLHIPSGILATASDAGADDADGPREAGRGGNVQAESGRIRCWRLYSGCRSALVSESFLGSLTSTISGLREPRRGSARVVLDWAADGLARGQHRRGTMREAICEFCGRPVDLDSKYVRREVAGWWLPATGEFVVTETTGEYAHGRCVAERELATNWRPAEPPVGSS